LYRPQKVRPKKFNFLEVGIFMAKYSYELKKKVVLAYLHGEGGYTTLANKYGIKHKTSVENWVRSYKEEGIDGLLRSRKNTIYSFEYKCAVVELYLTSELSVLEIARQEKIHNPGVISAWINRYRTAGPDALREQKRGAKGKMHVDNTNKPKDLAEETVNTSIEHVKELEAELLKLRIENAFLKELRRLRLEDEAKMRDLHESSTVSEDSLN